MTLRATRIFIIALLVAGCAAPVSPGSSGNVVAFPPTQEVEGLRLPFDAYTFSLAGLYTLANAQDLLTHECMQARGYDWEIIERPTDLKDLRNRRRYGVIETDIAQQFGYHVPAGLLTPLDLEQRYAHRESGLSENQTEAALGAGGCAREAVTRIQPDESPDLDLLQHLSRASLGDSQTEPRVAEVMRAWRNCVRDMGFDYQDPFAAMSDSRWWAEGSTEASSQEIAVAVADVRCKEQTGLVEVWHAAEVQVQEEGIQRHSAYFQEIGAAMEEELAAANAALA
jgi:hypothetical protein